MAKKDGLKGVKKAFSSPAKHNKNLGQTAFLKESKASHDGEMSMKGKRK